MTLIVVYLLIGEAKLTHIFMTIMRIEEYKI